MELNYIPAESTVEPKAIEVGVTTVYFRRNAVLTQREDMDGNTTDIWSYEEAALNKDQALLYLSEMQADLESNIADADAVNIDQEYRLVTLELGL